MNVTVFSTKGKKRQVVESTANTWGELQKELNAQGIETKGFKAICGESQVTFESSAAALPKGLTQAGEVSTDFTLFLTPIKVKSGCDAIDVEAMDYKACKAFIKEEIDSDPEAKAHFGNYTILSTAAMRELIEGWLIANSEELEEASAMDILDDVIASLEVLKSKLEAGEVTEEEVADEVEVLSAWFKEIESNM